MNKFATAGLVLAMAVFPAISLASTAQDISLEVDKLVNDVLALPSTTNADLQKKVDILTRAITLQKLANKMADEERALISSMTSSATNKSTSASASLPNTFVTQTEVAKMSTSIQKTVTTYAASSITANSAYVAGSYSNFGSGVFSGSGDANFWMQVGRTEAVSDYLFGPISVSGSGDWGTSVTGLLPGTTYYFRAIAQGKQTNSSAYAGDIRKFTTLSSSNYAPTLYNLTMDPTGQKVKIVWRMDWEASGYYSYQVIRQAGSSLLNDPRRNPLSLAGSEPTYHYCGNPLLDPGIDANECTVGWGDAARNEDGKPSAFTASDGYIYALDQYVTPGKTYTYAIVAIKNNEKTVSNYVTYTIPGITPATGQPTNITDLRAVSNSVGSVTLYWTKPVSNAGYDIYMSTDPAVPLNSSLTSPVVYGLNKDAVSYTTYGEFKEGGTYWFKVFPLSSGHVTSGSDTNGTSNIAGIFIASTGQPTIRIKSVSGPTSVKSGDLVKVDFSSDYEKSVMPFTWRMRILCATGINLKSDTGVFCGPAESSISGLPDVGSDSAKSLYVGAVGNTSGQYKDMEVILYLMDTTNTAVEKKSVIVSVAPTTANGSLPTPVSGLTNLTQTGVTVSWGAVSGADEYNVWWPKMGNAWNTGGTAATAQTSYTITGLSPATAYDVYVFAVHSNNVGNSNPDKHTFTTLAVVKEFPNNDVYGEGSLRSCNGRLSDWWFGTPHGTFPQNDSRILCYDGNFYSPGSDWGGQAYSVDQCVQKGDHYSYKDRWQSGNKANSACATGAVGSAEGGDNAHVAAVIKIVEEFLRSVKR